MPFPAVLTLAATLAAGMASRDPAHFTGASLQPAQPAATSDLDRFMEQVLARREVNRKTLNDYVLDETETFEILGPGRVPLSRSRRQFTWYVRDGMHVRSPVRFDGVEVGTDARDAYERRWIAGERRRREREAKRDAARQGAEAGPPRIPTEPRFVSEAYFMDFKFEPGNYLLAGRERFENHDVLRIEYYPTRLFNDSDEDGDEARGQTASKEEERDSRQERRAERDVERRMNKTALVTLWVDAEEHQIVKYTFENVWLDFLPGAWLVRVDDIRASMTMGQPFPGVWLPREIDIRGSATLASGSFSIALSRTFSDYREAQVSTKVSVPKAAPPRDPVPPPHEPDNESFPPEMEQGRGPFIQQPPAAPAAAEIIREVRVHGNAFLSDQEVLAIVGVTPGSPVTPETVAAIRKRLEDSGRFETVDVRKRYRSLTDPTDVAIVVVVHERPGVRSDGSPPNPVNGAFRRIRDELMFLPIVSYADGYGFTYGARFSTVDLLSAGERLSIPLTWGGTRRAALEFERVFQRGPLTRIAASAAIWQRENPRFEIDEQRREFNVGAERRFANLVTLGAGVSRSHLDFGELSHRQWTLGALSALDTRADPAFPANAVYLGAGWTGLHGDGGQRIDRYSIDTRGYLRLAGQSVVAARAQYVTADATLPPYERLLLGGAATLRGFRAGSFDGDRMLVTSAELRVPITPVISGAKFGITVFTDAARVVDSGEKFAGAKWRRGIGAGAFLIASIVKINLDLARGLDGGGTRLHLASGFAF